MVSTIGDRLIRREAAGFVGRTSELLLFDEALSGGTDRNVLLVHGPGGIGKTALLRAMRRRAEELGREVRWSDGISAELVARFQTTRPVVLVDHAEVGEHLLRQIHLPRIAEGAVVVIAARRPLGVEWRCAGWERITLDVPLERLGVAESYAILADCGVHDDEVCGSIIAFAGGLPLALVVAAGAIRAGRDAWLEWSQVCAELDLVTTRPPVVDAGIVRNALNRLSDPVALAGSSFASGYSASERAAAARDLLLSAMDTAFGDCALDQEMRTILRHRYVLEPNIGHEVLARRLTLSRATYFRRLQDALARMAAWISADSRSISCAAPAGELVAER
jgi:hypothetical protein